MRWFLGVILVGLVLGLGAWVVVSDRGNGTASRLQAAVTGQAADTGEVVTVEELKARMGERAFNEWMQQQREAANPEMYALRDRQIAEVADQTVESLGESLKVRDHSREGFYAYAFTAGLEDNKFPNGWLQAQVCLYDRRVCRMYDVLASMPPEQAAKTCQKLFDTCLKHKEEDWAQRFRELRSEGESQIRIGDHRHALSSLALLSALFCDRQTVISQVTRWRLGNVVAKGEALLLGRTSRVEAVRTHGEPDQLFVTHLLMLSLQKQGLLTPDLLDEARLLGLPRLREVPILRWNSRETFGMCTGIIPIPGDPADVVSYVTLTEAWGNRESSDSDAQNRVIDVLKSALYADDTETPEPTPADP